MSELKEGDIVWLNSGGPKMTMGRIEGGHAECSWFDDFKMPHMYSFPVICLQTLPELLPQGN